MPVRRVTHRRLRIETKLLAPPLKALQLVIQALRLRGMNSPPPVSPSMLSASGQEICLKVERAERILGMNWTDLPLGLRRAADWYLGSGTAAPGS